jgi:lysophospholipase L1-like esterase
MRVVLIGDSIRMGYMHEVRGRLGSRAEVVWPEANCGNTMLIRENLRAWVIDRDPDVVHFNAGIHDLGWMPDERTPRFTISAYRRHLRIIVQRMREGTSARLIFATTTPFLIPLDDRPKARCRIAPVVGRYNGAAVKLMRELDVAINDLYQAVVDAGVCECLGRDKIHMTDYGSTVLAGQVVSSLSATLGLGRGDA